MEEEEERSPVAGWGEALERDLPSQAELRLLARKGTGEARQAILDAHLRLAFRQVSDLHRRYPAADLEELVGVAIVGMAEGVRRYDPNGRASVTTWLRWHGSWALAQHVRREARWYAHRDPEPLDEPQVVTLSQLTPEQHTVFAERMGRLTDKERELVELHAFQGVELKEAAPQLGIGYSTAKRWWAAALEKVAEPEE